MSLNVIIVDDDSVVLFLHKILIEKSGGFSLTDSFENAQDALSFIRENEPGNPLLVLLDINMPAMDGWQFLDELQELKFRDRILVAMVTSSINKSDHEKAKNYSEVIAFLEKPISKSALEDLHKKVMQVLSSR